jgi:uncharacterized short protein YbdD (DUF466 family)
MTSIQIQALVRQMDESMRRHKGVKRGNLTLYKRKIIDENETLYNTLPAIFEMHFEGKLDQKFFEMLKLRRKVETGEMTEEEASKIVGQLLFDQYVAPVVNNTPAQKPLSYEEYYKQFDQNKQDEQPSNLQPSSEEKPE